MKKIDYLSPTAIATYLKSKDDFYLDYLTEKRPPRPPQTQPMSIGSAFDAYAKSFLHQSLFGKSHDPRFEFQAIFEAQVEPHNRDWAIYHGKHAFEQYQKSGALNDLMLDLNQSIGSPRFEFEVKGVVNGYKEGMTKTYDGVTFLGKPDVFYINKHGVQIIFDWKVNGWCGRNITSPKAGYIRVRRATGVHGGPHKDCMPMTVKGTMINLSKRLEAVDETWARQLAIYAWLIGVEIGSDFVAAVDQLACSPQGTEFPDIKVAEHRTTIGLMFQWQTFTLGQEIWLKAKNGHFFNELSKEESDAKCAKLDARAKAMVGDGTSLDTWFAQNSRAY